LTNGNNNATTPYDPLAASFDTLTNRQSLAPRSPLHDLCALYDLCVKIPIEPYLRFH